MDRPQFVCLLSRYWTLGCFHFLAITNNTSVTICVQVFVWMSIFIPLGYTARAYGDSRFNFLRNGRTDVHGSCTILHSHKQHMKVLMSSHPGQRMLSIYLFDYSCSSGHEVIFHCSLDLHFLVANDAEHLLICLLFSLEKNPSQPQGPRLPKKERISLHFLPLPEKCSAPWGLVSPLICKVEGPGEKLKGAAQSENKT